MNRSRSKTPDVSGFPKNEQAQKEHIRSLTRLFESRHSKKSRKRGRDNEARAFLALRHADPPLPDWIVSFRQAGRKDDYFHQTDIFVTTRDAGDVRVQVKSSVNAARRFRKRHQDNMSDIALVVANDEIELDPLKDRIVKAVAVIRKRRLEKRIKQDLKRRERTERRRKRMEAIIEALPERLSNERIISLLPAETHRVDENTWDFNLQLRVIGAVRLRVCIGPSNSCRVEKKKDSTPDLPLRVTIFLKATEDEDDVRLHVLRILRTRV